jgi:hypothetical protein
MAITKTDVIAIASELESVPDATWNVVLSMTAAQMNASSWGSKLDMAAVWLAAHLATMTQRSALAEAAKKSVTIGPISVSYDTSGDRSPTGAGLESTSYGQEYKRLCRLFMPHRLGV